MALLNSDAMISFETNKQLFKNLKNLETDLVKAFQEMIESLHNDDYQLDRDVYQIWNNGEITRQKGAGLFGSRTVHTISSCLHLVNYKMPVECQDDRSFAFVTEADARTLRTIMQKLFT